MNEDEKKITPEGEKSEEDGKVILEAGAETSEEPALQKGRVILPVLPLRDIVIFPRMLVPLFVGRGKSIQALQKIDSNCRRILLVTQKDGQEDIPDTDKIFSIGTVANILQLLKLPDGTHKILVEGIQRGRILHYTKEDDFLEAEVEFIEPDSTVDFKVVDELRRALAIQFEEYVKLNRKISQDVASSIVQIESAERFADSIAVHLNMKLSERQDILETFALPKRMEKIEKALVHEMETLLIERKVRGRVKHQMEKTQREYYLNEQLKAIQKELGEDEDRDELLEMEQQIKKLKVSKVIREKFLGELKKLRHMSLMSAEASVVRGYLDCAISVPWGHARRPHVNLHEAQNTLDQDHYGLEKIKERIIEHLAVQARTQKQRGPILCLVGPPGVGKTSLGQSMARATGRQFVRLSLGGVRDEAEIRGHRRTYIGAMPGKIIQSMRRAKRTNPLFLLDEIDKLGSDFRGDPASALLEVLDPEQNNAFVDHYLEVEYDLSQVMFVATANTLDIPPPLMDRLEIIRIAGYTEEEKMEICRRHLLKKSMKEHGIRSGELEIDDAVILTLIRLYTREAGVRGLERQINALVRKSLKRILAGEAASVHITVDNVGTFLGVPKYRFGQKEERDQIGLVTGLAWTEVGGELLTIEAIKMLGKGRVTVTGNLKEIMKESVTAASVYVKGNATVFGIIPPFFEKYDIHIHVPEGATPKDGPSAGVAMATAVVSLITGIPARADVAMTGEITLSGRVLAIGGLKEKLLAAARGGIKTVLVPKENMREFSEVPSSIKDNLNIVFVSHIIEVLQHALTRMPEPIEWDESVCVPPTVLSDNDSDPLVAH